MIAVSRSVRCNGGGSGATAVVLRNSRTLRQRPVLSFGFLSPRQPQSFRSLSTSNQNDEQHGHGVLDSPHRLSFRLFDSLSEQSQPIPVGSELSNSTTTTGTTTTAATTGSSKPSKKGLAWYTCGPTTYAPSHLGHARTYVCLDIVRRVLERFCEKAGLPPPLFVMNITDVDDKIIDAARTNGEPPVRLARRYEADFWRDMDALNCLRPQVVTRVTEHVESDLLPYIQRLCDNGVTYERHDGLYFDIRAFEAGVNKSGIWPTLKIRAFKAGVRNLGIWYPT